MKVHHGKIIEEWVYKSGHKKQIIAKKLGITRQTLTNKFKTTNLPIDFILKISKIINHDFSNEIPELKKFGFNTSNEPLTTSVTSKKEENIWKEKYIRLLENFNQYTTQKKEDSYILLANAIDMLRKELKVIVKR